MRVTWDDVKDVLGDVDDLKILEILTLKPTFGQLMAAASWATGNGETPARKRHSLTGVAAEIFSILIADAEDAPTLH